MKLAFAWKSHHSWLRVRLVLADGRDVMIVGDGRVPRAFPTRVENGEVLEIAEAFVSHGGSSHWLIRVLVDDPANAPMRGLSITALYDDSGEPDKTESLCDEEDVSANLADDFPKDLTIPPRRSGHA